MYAWWQSQETNLRPSRSQLPVSRRWPIPILISIQSAIQYVLPSEQDYLETSSARCYVTVAEDDLAMDQLTWDGGIFVLCWSVWWRWWWMSSRLNNYNCNLNQTISLFQEAGGSPKSAQMAGGSPKSAPDGWKFAQVRPRGRRFVQFQSKRSEVAQFQSKRSEVNQFLASEVGKRGKRKGRKKSNCTTL